MRAAKRYALKLLATVKDEQALLKWDYLRNIGMRQYNLSLSLSTSFFFNHFYFFA
jgi:DUF971 family protein